MLKKQYVKSRKVSKITFELAKSELPEGLEVDKVFLVGEFNDWDPAATPMKRDKEGATTSFFMNTFTATTVLESAPVTKQD